MLKQHFRKGAEENEQGELVAFGDWDSDSWIGRVELRKGVEFTNQVANRWDW